MISIRFSRFLLLLVVISADFVQSTMVRLVSTCTTKAGIGRCTIESSSCQDLGGFTEKEMQMDDGSKAFNACPADEFCCVIPPASIADTCTVCGRKGTDRQIRRSNLERHLEPGSTSRQRLRVLREVPGAVPEESPGMMGRIMNGDNAEKNEWCWQVALLNTDGTVLGSGSLINGRYIVTAAHKVVGRNSSNLVVLVGQYDFSLPVDQDTNSTVWYAKPLEVIIHERYNPETLDNDIALIRIPMVSCDSANICPVCLNNLSEQRDPMTSLSNCYITGWGASIKRDASPLLQEARVRILTAGECYSRFATFGMPDIQIPASTFCAEGIRDWTMGSTSSQSPVQAPMISTCSGDGGGPLVCEGADGRWHLMGLIAMGLEDCRQAKTNAPTVFVNVGMYVDWIRTLIDRRPALNTVGTGWSQAPPAVSDTTNQITGSESNDRGDRKPKSVDNNIMQMLPQMSLSATTTDTPPIRRVREPSNSRSVFGRSG